MIRVAALRAQVTVLLFLCGCGSKAPDLVAELGQAQREGITVVDSRRAVSDSGLPTKNGPLWLIDALPNGRAPIAEQELDLSSAKVVVIFVHGYNQMPSEALAKSRALFKHIRESNDALRAELPAHFASGSMAFVTFLWRGDLGEMNFTEAQMAAENTASAFSDFLKTVLRETRNARIVVLTHSLGSEVVLEALARVQRTSDMPVLDDLILVQPAIPAYSVYRWTVDYQMIPGPGVPDEPARVDECSGKYAESIRMAKQFVYTFSAKDTVLRTPFRLNAWLATPTRNCELPITRPVQTIALGGLFDTSNRTELLPPPKVFEPRTPQNHSGPQSIPILVPGSTLYHYKNFRIDHSLWTSKDITAVEDSDGGWFPGHSVLFQDVGKQTVEDLWRLCAMNWQ